MQAEAGQQRLIMCESEAQLRARADDAKARHEHGVVKHARGPRRRGEAHAISAGAEPAGVQHVLAGVVPAGCIP